MNYLESSANLKVLIEKTNCSLLESPSDTLAHSNKMMLRTNFGKEILLPMAEFTNEIVQHTLKEYETEAIVITDLVSTTENNQELTYILYKAYHKLFNKGLVYFQLVNKETLEAIDDLQFSNLEDNIFYTVQEPDVEESSCNAVETKENTAKNPSVAFLIGHMDEGRLIYDLNRLIYETANNVQKHKGRDFTFHLQISKFGGVVSAEFLIRIEQLKSDVDKFIHSNFSNSKFIFELEELK